MWMNNLFQWSLEKSTTHDRWQRNMNRNQYTKFEEGTYMGNTLQKTKNLIRLYIQLTPLQTFKIEYPSQ